MRGKAELTGVYGQDTWAFAPRWKSVMGLRAERWRVQGGQTVFAAPPPSAGAPNPPNPSLDYPSRRATYLSPKAALSFQALPDLILKASAGRAVRMPTVNELYGATSSANAQFINDPNSKPERSWTTELSAEKELASGLARLTWFTENTRDSVYSHTIFDAVANKNISRVQNIGGIQTQGFEAAYNAADVAASIGLKGLDFSGSLTYADSVIEANDGFLVVPGDTVGKRQPNIPKWRATALASLRITPQCTGALGARYSGPQYRTLNNADLNGFTYQGVSKYFTADVRVRWQITRQWSAAFGIDNLNNYRYWNFHPYTQRSYSAELKFDL